jgi:hypothetical protein
MSGVSKRMGKSEGGDVVLRRVLAAAFGAAFPSRPLLTHHKVNKETQRENTTQF